MGLVDRIWGAHPLQLTHRAVLLAIARQTPLGAREVSVSRTTLARELETTPEMVRRSLVAGETLGLCQLLRNGVVAWVPEALPGLLPEVKPTATAVAIAQGSTVMSPGPEITGPWVKGEFARQWEERYTPAKYSFMPGRDDKMAAIVARQLSSGDVVARIKNYLRHPNTYYAERSHPFELFANRINEFVAAPKAVRDDYERAEARHQRRHG